MSSHVTSLPGETTLPNPSPLAPPRKRLVLALVRVGVVLIALGALLVVLAQGSLFLASVAGPPVASEVSRPVAPDFIAPSFAGGDLTLSDFRGKPVVLNFWASWCPPCRAEASDLQRVSQAYRSRDVVFVGVNVQDSEPDARVYLRDFGVTYPNVRDTTDEISVAYGTTGLPTTFFVDREGHVGDLWVGPLTEQQLVARVEELLQ